MSFFPICVFDFDGHECLGFMSLCNIEFCKALKFYGLVRGKALALRDYE